ncbi:hypothetical protein [Calderihabitans maritimus]|uniref:hypothetical protein n=1 Tax=Calderihabitans maritimus TaxID=1246530 RepID=UPI000B50A8FF|nr:hypothetical protein [Calderihabitans maritimus]
MEGNLPQLFADLAQEPDRLKKTLKILALITEHIPPLKPIVVVPTASGSTRCCVIWASNSPQVDTGRANFSTWPLKLQMKCLLGLKVKTCEYKYSLFMLFLLLPMLLGLEEAQAG